MVTLTKNWLFHKDEIKDAISQEAADLQAHMWFKAGVDAAVVVDTAFGIDANAYWAKFRVNSWSSI